MFGGKHPHSLSEAASHSLAGYKGKDDVGMYKIDLSY